MTVYMEEEGSVTLELPCKQLAEKVIYEAVDFVGCPYECEVNLLLTMNREIKELNKEFRGQDHPTDVLSFPMITYENPGEFKNLEDQENCFHPETGELMLGDIVISKEKIIEQSKEYGHTIEREFAFLIAHSMLHLFGYDHIEEIQRQEMESKQREILDRLLILR